jgi:hypothetical protein
LFLQEKFPEREKENKARKSKYMYHRDNNNNNNNNTTTITTTSKINEDTQPNLNKPRNEYEQICKQSLQIPIRFQHSTPSSLAEQDLQNLNHSRARFLFKIHQETLFLNLNVSHLSFSLSLDPSSRKHKVSNHKIEAL